jgi:hypothetical protein
MEWDFAANQSIDEDTLAKAPEGYRGAYEKGDDGKYTISAAYKPFVDTVVGLGGALKNERLTSKGLKGQKDAVAVIKEQFGFDTVEEAKAKWDEMAQTIATNGKVDPAKIKADIQKGFDAQLGAKDKELDGMRGTLSKYLVDNAAISALAELKGNQKLLGPVVKGMVELVKDGDEYVVRVKDGQGDYRGDGKGGFLTVAGLVAEMKQDKDYAAAFESEAPAGSDRQIGQPRPGTSRPTGVRREDMSPTEMIAAGLQQRR